MLEVLFLLLDGLLDLPLLVGLFELLLDEALSLSPTEPPPFLGRLFLRLLVLLLVERLLVLESLELWLGLLPRRLPLVCFLLLDFFVEALLVLPGLEPLCLFFELRLLGLVCFDCSLLSCNCNGWVAFLTASLMMSFIWVALRGASLSSCMAAVSVAWVSTSSDDTFLTARRR